MFYLIYLTTVGLGGAEVGGTWRRAKVSLYSVEDNGEKFKFEIKNRQYTYILGDTEVNAKEIAIIVEIHRL